MFQRGVSKRFVAELGVILPVFFCFHGPFFFLHRVLWLNSLSFGLDGAEFVVFFCVDFMPRTMNNSLATTMFEGESEVVPSTGADVVSSAGSSVLQAGQNISTSSDTLAQAMSRALTDSLPGILAALRTHNAVPSQSAPPNSNPSVISTSSPAPLTQASLGQATTSGNFIVPLFVSTFSTLSTPAHGFSSLPLPSGLGSPAVGGGVVSAFPAISVSSAAVGKDFVIGPGYSPIPHKLVTKIKLVFLSN